MNRFVRFIAFIAFFLTFKVFAQDFQFTARGIYPTETQALTPTPVSFTVSWNEKKGQIIGSYTDNYYSLSPTPVRGNSSELGRNIIVTLPTTALGVQTVSVYIPTPGLINASVPMTVVTRAPGGNVVNTSTVSATMTSDTDAPIDEDACSLGFGPLTGFCGRYGGLAQETLDTMNQCNLLAVGNMKLELSNTKALNVYASYVDTTYDLPMHRIGTLPATPPSTTLSQRSVNCGPLVGTSFAPKNCQELLLEGSFSEAGAARTFVGTYTIRDQVTNDRCTYLLNFSREQEY